MSDSILRMPYYSRSQKTLLYYIQFIDEPSLPLSSHRLKPCQKQLELSKNIPTLIISLVISITSVTTISQSLHVTIFRLVPHLITLHSLLRQ
ncbi:hypothetical protein CC78DRAFT_70845 [Lojkania enalia]|uniref:Uncharacterized protein n=1 Tax=Lojkania enalia TaxID=147567 RepID=A0A9P4K136_9PLEO|nr:hypothetical protein CC78DRAFT_70845 [Didymosphaeria enalia]